MSYNGRGVNEVLRKAFYAFRKISVNPQLCDVASEASKEHNQGQQAPKVRSAAPRPLCRRAKRCLHNVRAYAQLRSEAVVKCFPTTAAAEQLRIKAVP